MIDIPASLVSTTFTNNPHGAGALPSYDSFDDPLSGSRIHSLRSSSPSDEDHAFAGMALSHLNVAGSRRSIDFQSQSLRSSFSSNFNENSNAICQTYTTKHTTSSLKSFNSSSSIRYNISFSLPAMFNNINR